MKFTFKINKVVLLSIVAVVFFMGCVAAVPIAVYYYSTDNNYVATAEVRKEADELWPAYRLDNELAPVRWEATPTAVVLPVCANGQARGIVCDQIRTFDHPVAVSLHAVPGCLRERRSPVIALGLYETLRVGLVIRGDGMIRHLDEMLGNDARG